MKLIHTSDLHLDGPFEAAGMPAGFGNRRRQGLRKVLQKIMKRAADWPADAVLIAGDLFDADRVTRDTLAFLRDVLASAAPVPVFIAPGNHDPYTPAAPYATEPWPDNVHIFCQPQWTAMDVPGSALTVHGFAFDGPEVSDNPFGRLAIERDERLHVAVAHGSERGHQPPGQENYAPFDAASAAPAGLTYLALGHFHDVLHIPGPYATQVYYSGAPEGHGFRELGNRHYLEVTITPRREAGYQVQVAQVPSNEVVYQAYEIDCGAFEHSQQLIEGLRELAAAEGRPLIARVTLRGACSDALREALPAVRDAAAGDFEMLDLADRTEPEEDYAVLAREETGLGEFTRRLNAQIADAPSPDQRAMLERARQLGVSAYRGHRMPIRGIEGAGR